MMNVQIRNYPFQVINAKSVQFVNQAGQGRVLFYSEPNFEGIVVMICAASDFVYASAATK